MEKRVTQPDNIGKPFPYKPNNPTSIVPSQSPLTTIAKNQVNHHTKKHRHTKKKTKTKDSNFPKKIGLLALNFVSSARQRF